MKVQEFVAHSTQVNCIAFGTKSHQVFATGGEDTRTNIWRVGSAANIWTLGSNKSPIESLCFDAEEQCVVTGAMNGSIKVFDLNAGKLARNIGGHQVNTCTIQYHPYAEFIVSGSIDSSMKLWDVRNKICVQTYGGHEKEVTCVRFSPDGRWVASSSKDGNLIIHDIVAGKVINTLKLAPNYITSFEFNPTEFHLAAVTSSRNVKLWDLDTMKLLCTTPADSNPIRRMCFSSEGDSLYTATKDSLKLWSLEGSPRLKAAVDVAWDKVDDLKVSKSDGIIAGACNCNFVSIWTMPIDSVSAQSQMVEGKAVMQQQQQQRQHSLQNLIQATQNANLGAQEKPSRRPRHSLGEDIQSAQRPDRLDIAEEKNMHRADHINRNLLSPSSRRSLQAKREGLGTLREGTRESNADEKDSTRGSRDSKEEEAAAEIEKILTSSQRMRWESEHSSRATAASLEGSFMNRYKEERGKIDGGVAGLSEQERLRAEIDELADIGSADEVGSDDDIDFDIESMCLKVDNDMLPTINRFPDTRREEHKDHVKDETSNRDAVEMRKASDLGDDNGFGYVPTLIEQSPSASRRSSRRHQERQERDEHRKYAHELQRELSDDFMSPTVCPVGGPDASTSVALAPVPSSDLGRPVRDDSTKGSNSERVRRTPDRDKDERERRGNRNDESLVKAQSEDQDPRYRFRSDRDRDQSTPDPGGVGGGLEINGRRHGSLFAARDARDARDAGSAPRSSGGSAKRRTENNRDDGRGLGAGAGVGRRGASNGGGSDEREDETTACIDRLNEIVQSSSIFTTACSQRLAGLRVLRRLWGKGDVGDVIEHLGVIIESASLDKTQLFLLADFLNSIEIKQADINLDGCARMLELLDTMTNGLDGAGSARVVSGVLKSMISLLDAFAELIRSTRAAISIGVDLSKEERIKKCNICYQVVHRMKMRMDQLRHQHRKDKKIQALIVKATPLIDVATSS